MMSKQQHHLTLALTLALPCQEEQERQATATGVLAKKINTEGLACCETSILYKSLTKMQVQKASLIYSACTLQLQDR